MIVDKITKDLEIATRKQDPLVLKTIRFILSEIRYLQIDKQRPLNDEETISLLQKEIKKRNEAITLMKKANRQELVDEEEKKIEVIKQYLPQQLDLSQLEEIVDKVISSMEKPQLGMVISAVRQQTVGKAEGSIIAQIVKKKLNLVG